MVARGLLIVGKQDVSYLATRITTGNCQPTVLRVGKKKRKDTIVVGGGGHGCGHDYGHKEVMAMPIPVYLPPPPKPQVIIKHEHIHHRPVYAPVVIDKSSMYDHLNSVYDHYDDYEGQHYGARHEYGGGYR